MKNNFSTCKIALHNPPDTLTEEHIGLKNVHDQIRYYFGDQYGIEIDSILGVGTTVTIRIPARDMKLLVRKQDSNYYASFNYLKNLNDSHDKMWVLQEHAPFILDILLEEI